jgi:uncharacterized membrane protein
VFKKIVWNDATVEVVIGNLLRLGVLVAATVVAGGGVIYLARHGSAPASYAVFRGEPNDLRHTSGIFKEVLGGRSRGIIQLGLILLIATPVARVAFSAVAFALEKDTLYFAVTMIVLTILLYSLLGSHA